MTSKLETLPAKLIILLSIGAIIILDTLVIKEVQMDAIFYFSGGTPALNLLLALIIFSPLCKKFSDRMWVVIAALIPNIINLIYYFFDLALSGFKNSYVLLPLFIGIYFIIRAFIKSYKRSEGVFYKVMLFILFLSTIWSLLTSFLFLHPCFAGACI